MTATRFNGYDRTVGEGVCGAYVDRNTNLRCLLPEGHVGSCNDDPFPPVEDHNARLDRIEESLARIEKAMDTVASTAGTVYQEVMPMLDSLMEMPMVKMFLGKASKKVTK